MFWVCSVTDGIGGGNSVSGEDSYGDGDNFGRGCSGDSDGCRVSGCDCVNEYCEGNGGFGGCSGVCNSASGDDSLRGGYLWLFL